MFESVLITGASGQDGRILSSLLPDSRQILLTNDSRVLGGLEAHEVVEMDVTATDQLAHLIAKEKPSALFHFAAKSSVAESWEKPDLSLRVNTLGTLNILEAVRRFSPQTRVILAGSSEIFARRDFTADESSAVEPSSPYGIAKATNLELGKLYRSVHGLFVSTAIMFNHESTLRPSIFVSKEIANQAARVALGLQDKVRLQDLRASKDWGWAPEFVEAMILMAKNSFAADYILATGRRTSVGELAEFALRSVGLSADSIDTEHRSVSRPNDKVHPIGSFQKAQTDLGWSPKVLPGEFMGQMVRFSINEIERET